MMIKRRNFSMFIFLFMTGVVFIIPFFSLVAWSFTKLWPWPELVPENIQFDSWRFLFSPAGRAFEGLWNSALIALLTVLGNILIGIPAARTMSQKYFFGKGFIFVLFLSPLFIPLTVSIIGMHHLAIRFHFLNEYAAVALAHILVTFPYFFAMVWYQYRLVGTSLQEAAKTLGASPWKVFKWVELPLILPGVILSCLLVAVISFSQYLPTWIMSGGTLLTLPLIIFPYAESGNASLVAAYSLLFFVPVFLLVAIYFAILKKVNVFHRGELK